MIVIIDNYDSFTYNIYQSIAKKYHDVRVFRNDKISVAKLQQLPLSGIILSPGPGRPEDAGICLEVVKKLAPSIPILGVCLGHQTIAQAFGGQVIHANDIVHGKPTLVSYQRDPLFIGMPQPFKAGRYHSLTVDKQLPSSLLLTAENANGMVMAIKHQKYPCFGIQFHPESILTPQGDQLLNNFVAICQQQTERQELAC